MNIELKQDLKERKRYKSQTKAAIKYLILTIAIGIPSIPTGYFLYYASPSFIPIGFIVMFSPYITGWVILTLYSFIKMISILSLGLMEIIRTGWK